MRHIPPTRCLWLIAIGFVYLGVTHILGYTDRNLMNAPTLHHIVRWAYFLVGTAHLITAMVLYGLSVQRS